MFHCGAAVVIMCTVVLEPGLTRDATQQPRTIELDAETLAARTDAARSLIPLLEGVRRRTQSRVDVQRGTVPDSPFAGTQTTLFAISLGKRSVAVDPQVVKAMDRLLAWEPGNRAAEVEAALFDEWLDWLTVKTSALATRKGLVLCDARCVTQTMTQLDETWGSSASERAEFRDQLLLDALTEAVSQAK
jgi:hypothetical protein